MSLVERGRIEDVSVRSLRALARAVGGELRLDLWFRGGELDRLLDEGHASLVGAIVARLEGLGWECRPEVSFAVFAERGSIDVVAWHPATRTLLVIEVKTELVSVEETLRRHDVKVGSPPTSCAAGSDGSHGPWLGCSSCQTARPHAGRWPDAVMSCDARTR